MKCIFCGKTTRRMYKIGKSKKICIECRDLYLMFKHGNSLKILSILGYTKTYKHCLFCGHYIKPGNRCRKGMATGVERIGSYPFSYANHGCHNYFEK